MAAAQAVGLELERIGAAASFVSQRTAPADDLRLEVAGVGRIRFPVSAAIARKLCAVAKPARHGYKQETRLDRRVRDTFEIDKRQIDIDSEPWQHRLHAQLEHIRRDLGLPEGCRLQADLHNLLIYGPGQFFVSHQDSEKADGMLASLVVGLPSTFSGGAMLIEHHGEKTIVRGSASRLGLTAFYADCQHQVQAVKQGYRLALTYNLRLEGQGRTAAASTESLAALTERVRQYFASPLPSRWQGHDKGPAPDRLIYLFDHQYTQRGLDWGRLKGADGPRAAALQAVASALDCEICLALADVHETWNCVDESYGGGAGRKRWRSHDEWLGDDDEDDIDEPACAEDFELTDLLDSEAELKHFVGTERRTVRMPGAIDPRELCYSKPSAELDPFRSEHEGFMGNYGNTVDRWYHRAAMVLWPRSRDFVLRAQVEPRWAIGEVSKALKSRGTSAAAEQARLLLPVWAGAVRDADDARLFGRTLALAADLTEPTLAAMLLTPFSVLQLKASIAPHWLRCLERYGLEWCDAVLSHWRPLPHANDSERLSWIAAELPDVCQSLRGASHVGGCTLAERLLEQEWRWVGKHWRGLDGILSPESRDKALAALSKPLLALIDASARVDDSSLHQEIVAALSAEDGDTTISPALAVGVLRVARSHATTPGLRLASLCEHWRRRIDTLLAAPARHEDDWSIATPLQCHCGLCVEVDRFLRDAGRIRHEWPLAEQSRKHIHRTIDAHALPLTHTTRRSGRPYVLVLEKTRALFAREAALRREWQQDLDWLTAAAAEF